MDLYFLFKDGKFDIIDLITLGKQKDAGLEPFQWAKVIQDAESISIMPRMIVECRLSELQLFVKSLRDKVLDSVKPN